MSGSSGASTGASTGDGTGNSTGGTSGGDDKGGDSGYTPPATQEDLNRIIADRVARERAKYGDYKDLKAKAAQFDQMDQANKSEAEKAADRIARAEKAAQDAEARATRREVALEHQLSADDAQLLDGITDQEAMRRLASRLSQQAQDRKKPPTNYVPREGANTKSAGAGDEREAVRALFGG